MADRTQYFHEYYLNHKVRKNAQTIAWLEKHKENLGIDAFREWKKKENEKYRKRNLK